MLLELVGTTGAEALLPDLVVRFDPAGVVVRRPFMTRGVGREVFVLTSPSRTPVVEAVTARLRGAAMDVRSPGRPSAPEVSG